MRLASLELKNIRSYRQQTVEFPDGITLLSGDIGAGKSTLLQAIEFALFGISRGELNGNALLRHGAADGMVLLRMTVGKTSYAIMRTLKRSASGVVQDTGWIETEGVREQLTASELRAKVYEILGYPLQFLSKQRNVLYRFTVYTPQEEMKSILLQTAEERLETIRRIFGVDAYRIARDNAHLLAKALRERETASEQVLARMRVEDERLTLKLARQDELATRRSALFGERALLAANVELHEKTLLAAEAQRAVLAQRQQLLAMQDRNRKIAQQELQQLQIQLERKEKSLSDARESAATLQRMIVQAGEPNALAQEQLVQAQGQLEQLVLEAGKILGIIEQCKHVPSVAAGTTCPTCRQNVTSEHLDQVQAMLAAQGAAARKKHERLLERMTELRTQIVELQENVERSRRVLEYRNRLVQQEQTVTAYNEDLQGILSLVAAKKHALTQLVVEVEDGLVERIRIADQQLIGVRSDLQRQRQHLLDLEKTLARIEQEAKDLAEAATQLAQVKAEQTALQSHMDDDARIRSWVQKQFTPFAATVERHVLLSIHAAFDAVFRQWFARLIDDDALSTRIDHAFAPLMLQHGYEADVANLSGGERTAVSLAYRLSLVHTIHLLSSHLGTAGVILLDEPTDGFSAEQLERVRDVLRELRMQQIILVSHEQQLEGFVDHIIRVRKTGDGSEVEVAA